jgi:hypothetical protein
MSGLGLVMTRTTYLTLKASLRVAVAPRVEVAPRVVVGISPLWLNLQLKTSQTVSNFTLLELTFLVEILDRLANSEAKVGSVSSYTRIFFSPLASFEAMLSQRRA